MSATTPTLLVSGGRDFDRRGDAFAVLDDLHRVYRFCLVIEGGARGADALARAWAAQRLIPNKTFKADWSQLGNRAGPIRNQLMLAQGQPDIVASFPGGIGTADLLTRAHAHFAPKELDHVFVYTDTVVDAAGRGYGLTRTLVNRHGNRLDIVR